ncbi:MAG: winged helix-turn-helix domain-containing protein [Cytophagales bacterium]|nr:winged helix-turn-helix domain-containing protein [Cytophagales bacterium]MDW8385364.1 winged helix-turn-helix domain-containing protein [Flammeovirgaceae bacterium]
MKSDNVKEAFEILIEELETCSKDALQKGMKLIEVCKLEERTWQAKIVLQIILQIMELKSEIEAKLEEWKKIRELEESVISGLSSKFSESEVKKAMILEEKVAGSSPCLVSKPIGFSIGRHRRQVVDRTLEKEFRIPILRALVKLGGSAKTSNVLNEVYEEVKHKLKTADFEELPSGGKKIRWRNAACWERKSMVEEGLLERYSPRGIWTITEKGRKFLEENENL